MILAIERRFVLQAFDIQVPPNVGGDLVSTGNCTLQVCVAAAGDRQLIPGCHMCIDLGGAFSVRMPRLALTLAVKPTDVPFVPIEAPIPAAALIVLLSLC